MLQIDGCPHARAAEEAVARALAALGHRTPVERVAVRTAADAQASGFAGSPTILVDGEDLFPPGVRAEALACRVYATADGLAGAPSQAQVEAALRGRLTDSATAGR